MVLLVSLSCLFIQGCLLSTQTPKPPSVIVIRDAPRVYPIQPPEGLEPIIIYPLDEPGIIGGIKQEDIEAIWRNHLRLFKWGAINEATLEEINREAREKAKEIKELEKKESK
jgi:hypothetical protein